MSQIIDKKLDLFDTVLGQMGIVTEQVQEFDVDDLMALKAENQALNLQFQNVGDAVKDTGRKTALPSAFVGG